MSYHLGQWPTENNKLLTTLPTISLMGQPSYLATRAAMVTTENPSEFFLTQHAHRHPRIWNPHWSTGSDLEVFHFHLNLCIQHTSLSAT